MTLPWYKRHPADWRTGTRKHGMSLELRGFYSECLDAMWELQGQLPKDCKTLSMLLGSNPRQVRALMARLLAIGKMIETATGYYNYRMMADILGAERVPETSEFLAVSKATRDPIDLQSTSNRPPIDLQSTSKVPENPMFSTREVDSDSEKDTSRAREASSDGVNSAETEAPPKRAASVDWTAVLNPSAASATEVRISESGSVDLLGGTRARWLADFGSEERLRLALTQATPYIQTNTRRPLLVVVEAQLARQLAAVRDQDRRYAAAAGAKPAKTTTTTAPIRVSGRRPIEDERDVDARVAALAQAQVQAAINRVPR
jgi:uncharacterized protein YdaU (DUF1376 family)